MKKHYTLTFVLFLYFLSNCFAQKITVKGEVRDEFGQKVNNLSISVNKVSNFCNDNKFELDINANDSLHFELDGEEVKDTVLSNPDIFHVIKLKLQVDSSEVYYAPLKPEFQVKRYEISQFIRNNLQYPEDALKDSISGVVHVRFTLNEKGERTNYSVIPSVYPSIDKEAIRLLKLMPRMIPIRVGNKFKIANCFYPIDFSINEQKILNDTTTLTERGFECYSSDSISLYSQRIKPTAYPGGQKALMRFLKKHTKYPKEARKIKGSTSVRLFFLVNADGYLDKTRIEISANPILDAEAIRIIKSMPRWIPGEKNGYTGAVSAGSAQFITFRF